MYFPARIARVLPSARARVLCVQMVEKRLEEGVKVDELEGGNTALILAVRGDFLPVVKVGLVVVVEPVCALLALLIACLPCFPC